jgi:hypothetical protein
MIVVMQRLGKHPAMRASSCATNVCSSLLGSRPVSCLDGDDMVRDATIEQAVFSVSPLRALGGYIIRPTTSVQSVPSVQCSAAWSSL